MSFEGEAGWLPEAGEILTVSSLLSMTRGVLEKNFPLVWLEGEVGNARIPASGHAYFTLGDEGGQIRAVCFRSTLRLVGRIPEDGLRVLVRGRLTLYEARGDLQLVVEDIEEYGEGFLRLEYEARKQRLAAAGWFDAGRKRALPPLPSLIGVVTSPTGAAIHDILEVLRRRAPGVHVVLSPARVQGEGAAVELLAALELLVEEVRPDVVILGRGGGSYEDLWEFNDEDLVRAVASSPVPVIAAVGHEVDVSLVDFAADVRAPTPSAAAELAVQEWEVWSQRVERAERNLEQALGRILAALRSNLERLDVVSRGVLLRGRIDRLRMGLDRRLEAGVGALGRLRHQQAAILSEWEARLVRVSPELRMAQASESLRELERRSSEAVACALRSGRQSVHLWEAKLGALSPLGVLGRGYALVRNARGRIVADARDCAVGETLGVTLARGGLACRVLRTSSPDAEEPKWTP
jgi:exodeoxyribonuclease VII large subunit